MKTRPNNLISYSSHPKPRLNVSESVADDDNVARFIVVNFFKLFYCFGLCLNWINISFSIMSVNCKHLVNQLPDCNKINKLTDVLRIGIRNDYILMPLFLYLSKHMVRIGSRFKVACNVVFIL